MARMPQTERAHAAMKAAGFTYGPAGRREYTVTNRRRYRIGREDGRRHVEWLDTEIRLLVRAEVAVERTPALLAAGLDVEHYIVNGRVAAVWVREVKGAREARLTVTDSDAIQARLAAYRAETEGICSR